MANIRIKSALDRIGNELSRVRVQTLYSGISAAEARLIDNMATDIAVEAAEIAAEARNVIAGIRGKEAAATHSARFVAKVRKALGFTYP